MKTLSFLLVTLSALLFSSPLVSSQLSWEVDPATTLATTEAAGSISIYITPNDTSSATVTYNFTLFGASLSDFNDPAGGVLAWTGTADNQTITINILEDLIYEGTEIFQINFFFPAGDTPSVFHLNVSIADDEILPIASIGAPVQVVEGTGGITLKNITVTLPNATASPCILAYSLTALSAFSGVDFLAGSGAIIFPPGSKAQNVSVSIIGDATNEDPEVFIFGLVSQSPTVCGVSAINPANGAPYNIIIVDDDALPVLNFVSSTYYVTEGSVQANSPNLYFNLTITPASGRTINVTYVVNNGTGVNGIDFTTLGTTQSVVSIPANLPWAQLYVRVIADTIYEPNKTLSITVTKVVNANQAFNGTSANGIIIDDDAVPKLSIFNNSIVEGDSSNSSLIFTITSPTKTPASMTIWYSVAASTADDTDVILGEFSTVMIQGNFTAFAPVTVIGDLVPETAYEYFTVTILNATTASYAPLINAAAQTAYGTIIDNDQQPEIIVIGGKATEGSASFITYNISIPFVISSNIDFTYQTVDDTPSTATSGSDYTAVTSSATITAGTTYVLVNVTGIADDSIAEDTEFVYLNVTSVTSTNAQLNTTSIGFGSIIDNDNNALPTLYVTNTSLVEGDNGTSPVVVDVWLSESSERTVTFTWATKDETAYSPLQYVESAGTVVIPRGETNATVTVYVVGDTDIESDMTFIVRINNVTGAFFGNNTAGVLIIDNDELTTITVQSDEYQGSPRFNPRFISLVVVIAVVVVLMIASIVGFFALKRYVS